MNTSALNPDVERYLVLFAKTLLSDGVSISYAVFIADEMSDCLPFAVTCML